MSEEDRRSQVEARWEQIGKEVPRAPGYTNEMEDLHDFFDMAADIWDEKFGPGSAQIYVEMAGQISPTEGRIRILDLGCGTGLELDQVFLRAPNASITGIDLAAGMLNRLRKKYRARADQIQLIEGNYLDVPFGKDEYDYAISSLTTHHLPPENKVIVYRKIFNALKPHGSYIEGDQTTSKEGERDGLDRFRREVARLPEADRARWNYDITLSPDTNTVLLREAGFKLVNLIRDNEPGKCAVIAARKTAD